MQKKIDTTNKFLVSASGNRIVILKPPTAGTLNKEDALLFAAWLVTMSFADDGEFEQVLAAVQNA